MSEETPEIEHIKPPHPTKGRKYSELHHDVSNGPRFDAPIKRALKEIGGEDAVIALCEMQEDPKFAALIALMTNPEYASTTFGWKLKASGVTLHQLQTVYLDQGKHLALMRLASAVPEVAADIAEDARTVVTACEKCNGEGEIITPLKEAKVTGDKVSISETKKCMVCDGTGQIRKIGDKHSRDLLFQSTGLVSNGKMSVAMGQQISLGADMDAGIENVLRLTQAIVMKVGE